MNRYHNNKSIRVLPKYHIVGRYTPNHRNKDVIHGNNQHQTFTWKCKCANTVSSKSSCSRRDPMCSMIMICHCHSYTIASRHITDKYNYPVLAIELGVLCLYMEHEDWTPPKSRANMSKSKSENAVRFYCEPRTLNVNVAVHTHSCSWWGMKCRQWVHVTSIEAVSTTRMEQSTSNNANSNCNCN